MSGITIKVGDTVLCGYCGIDATVEAVKVYVRGIGFLLGCGHRNGYCEACKIPVSDISQSSKEISPVCPFCTTTTA